MPLRLSSCSSCVSSSPLVLFHVLPNTNHPLYRSNTHAEDAPEMADLYFAYGKALLENAIAQNSVLGKEQQQQQDGAVAEGTACPLIYVMNAGI
jgi:hypothetical protein